MGQRVSREVLEKRREVVASLLARGLRQSEIVDTLSQPKYTAERLNDGKPNPYHLINPSTKEPFDKSTISRDVKALVGVWRENAAVDAEEHFARQLAELTELRRAAWARKDLSEVRQCLALEMKLLGTAKPEKFEHGVSPEDRGRVDRLANIFQSMRRQEEANGFSNEDNIANTTTVGSN